MTIPTDPTITVTCPTCKRRNFVFRTRCMKCGHPMHEAPKDADLLTRIEGWACQYERGGIRPRVIRGPWFDDEGYQRAERINGQVFCCELWWPFIEEPEAWRRDEKNGVWLATEWGPGAAECLDCGRFFIDAFDGCFVLK